MYEQPSGFPIPNPARGEGFFIQPCVHTTVRQACVQSADSVTVRVPQGDDMGMTEEYFEGAFFSHFHPVLK